MTKSEKTTWSARLKGCIRGARHTMLPLAMIGGLSAALAISACDTADTPGAVTTCISDEDCALGKVCQLSSKECIAVDCSFCIDGQVCYDAGDGIRTCSKPECQINSDCGGAESCIKGLCDESFCADRSDCPEGQICNAFAMVCQDPPEVCQANTDCPMGQVCNGGDCSPGCSTDTECADAASFCNRDTNLCEPGCRTDLSCEADQACDAATKQCVCQQSKCEEGELCDEATNACTPRQITSCDEVTCGDNQICNPDNNFECEERPPRCSTVQGDPSACPAGQVCNQTSGQCQAMTCSNVTQADCDGTDNPVLSVEFCACVQCVDDSTCPAGASCNGNGQCIQGCQACDPNAAGSCGNDAPFCFSGCCVECTTNTECASNQVCDPNSGRCTDPPDCSADPSICPAGTTCMGSNCVANNGGADCSNDPTICPPDAPCTPDPATGSSTCQATGGGGLPGGVGCMTAADCKAGQLCDDAPLVGGITGIKVCYGCASNTDCKMGESCSSFFGGPRFCSPL